MLVVIFPGFEVFLIFLGDHVVLTGIEEELVVVNRIQSEDYRKLTANGGYRKLTANGGGEGS